MVTLKPAQQCLVSTDVKQNGTRPGRRSPVIDRTMLMLRSPLDSISWRFSKSLCQPHPSRTAGRSRTRDSKAVQMALKARASLPLPFLFFRPIVVVVLVINSWCYTLKKSESLTSSVRDDTIKNTFHHNLESRIWSSAYFRRLSHNYVSGKENSIL